MGGGGGAPHEVPDWKTYSNKVENIPELQHLQRRLAGLGLKDPWIRNEVWRFQESVGGNASWQRVGLRVTFRGFGLAAAAMALTILYDKTVNAGKDAHGHH